MPRGRVGRIRTFLERPLERWSQRMRPHHLLLLALLLFGIAQFLPAFWLDMGAWNQPEQPAIPGYLVTGLAWPYYLSNLALLLGPLLVRLFGRLKKPRRYFLILFDRTT